MNLILNDNIHFQGKTLKYGIELLNLSNVINHQIENFLVDDIVRLRQCKLDCAGALMGFAGTFKRKGPSLFKRMHLFSILLCHITTMPLFSKIKELFLIICDHI